jgi:ABC-type Mn2+/Zn2+ transport system permease subunit
LQWLGQWLLSSCAFLKKCEPSCFHVKWRRHQASPPRLSGPFSSVLTVNCQAVGGLMIYSLVTNPAAAAFQLVKGCGRAMTLAVALGAVSGLGGFLISAVIDLPSGAVIVLFSSALVPMAAVLARFIRRTQ